MAETPLGSSHIRVLAVLAREDSPRGMYGPDIEAAIGMMSGTIHPILARLEGHDYIESRWQNEPIWPTSRREAQVEPVSPPGRPRRRYCRITEAGHRARATQAAPAAFDSRRLAQPPKVRPQEI